MNFKLSALILSATLALTACGGDKAADTQAGGGASSTGADEVAARQSLMKDWRAASDILKGMTEDPSKFDKAVAEEQAKFLSESSQMWAHFGNEANKGKSQDTVWTDAAGFKAAADKFDAATAALYTAAQSAQSAGDIQAALGAVGESCGGCHKVFKQK